MPITRYRGFRYEIAPEAPLDPWYGVATAAVPTISGSSASVIAPSAASGVSGTDASRGSSRISTTVTTEKVNSLTSIMDIDAASVTAATATTAVSSGYTSLGVLATGATPAGAARTGTTSTGAVSQLQRPDKTSCRRCARLRRQIRVLEDDIRVKHLEFELQEKILERNRRRQKRIAESEEEFEVRGIKLQIALLDWKRLQIRDGKSRNCACEGVDVQDRGNMAVEVSKVALHRGCEPPEMVSKELNGTDVYDGSVPCFPPAIKATQLRKDSEPADDMASRFRRLEEIHTSNCKTADGIAVNEDSKPVNEMTTCQSDEQDTSTCKTADSTAASESNETPLYITPIKTHLGIKIKHVVKGQRKEKAVRSNQDVVVPDSKIALTYQHKDSIGWDEQPLRELRDHWKAWLCQVARLAAIRISKHNETK